MIELWWWIPCLFVLFRTSFFVHFEQLLARAASTCKLIPKSRKEKILQFCSILWLTTRAMLLALQVIDFEYSGYNPRAFDIANHFCEVGLFRLQP